MLKLATVAGALLIGAIVTTALAVKEPAAHRPAVVQQGLVDPTAMTLAARTRDLPVIAVDKAH